MNTLNDTIRYVTKVLQSCKTKEQFENSMDWAVSVIVLKANECKKQRIASGGNIHKPKDNK